MSKGKHHSSSHLNDKQNFDLTNFLPSHPNKIKGWKRRRQGSLGEIDLTSSLLTPVVKQFNFDDSSCSLQQKMAKRVQQAKSIGRTKQKKMKEEQRQEKKNRNEYELRQIIKSKDKQIKSLHSHVKVLSDTVQLLKDEMKSMSRQRQSRVQQQKDNLSKNYKKQYESAIFQNKKLKQQLTSYEQLAPNLSELQVIQNRLIQQNHELKYFKTHVGKALKELKTMMGHSSRSQTNHKLESLIDSVLN